MRYTYRADAAIPPFDDRHPVVVMDGECVLCTQGARWIARLDRVGEFRICWAQSGLGQSLLRHYGLTPHDPESWLYIVDGEAYTSLDAMIRAGRRMGGPGRLLQVLRLLPRRVQDVLYRWIARHRYCWFGRTDGCSIPDPALRARLME